MRLKGKFASGLLTFGLSSAMVFAQATTPQTGTTKSSDPHGQGSHSADHGMSSNKGAGLMVGKQDQQFMMKAAQGGLMEVEAARLGQEKATSNEVKEYARKLEQDHSKANDKLKAIAAQKNVDLPTDPGEHRAMLDKIKGLSGDEFDKAFMKMQVQHHKKDVSQFQKQADRAMDSDVRSFAAATLPTLQEHLKQAQELQASTRGRKSGNMDSDSNATSPTGSQTRGQTGAGSQTGTGTGTGSQTGTGTGTSTPTTQP